ncbi:family 10 glycosylhydrolase, partial [Roseateles sp. GG27B]
SQASSAPAANHLSQTQPSWVKQYGDQQWMDPGEPGAAAHTLAVCQDLLQRYEVDGLHIDDYFYPYPVNDP